jgi:hypothetical protein
MQKVVGSSPIIRFAKPAGNGGFLCGCVQVSRTLRIEERELEAGGLNQPARLLHVNSEPGPRLRRSRQSARWIP